MVTFKSALLLLICVESTITTLPPVGPITVAVAAVSSSSPG